MKSKLLAYAFLLVACAALVDMAVAYDPTFFDIGFGCPKSALSCFQECRDQRGHRGGYCNGPFNIVCTCY
uniref:Putative defensin n=1 Tax=Rhipicephalus microplus TaxID=6941 RepID=A0A6M2CXN5_RHIMP